MAGTGVVPCYGTAAGFPCSSDQHENGYWTLETTAGGIISVQPNGSVETRDPGTFGPYETAGRMGDLFVYCPDGKAVYSFRWVNVVPNVS